VASIKRRDAVKEVLTNPELQAWDRLPHETIKAFQAFAFFRSLDKRTLVKVAEELKCSVQNIGKWSLKYDWNERVRQWDLFNDRIAQQQEVTERLAMRKRHIQQAMVMQNLAAHGASLLQKKIELNAKWEMTPGEIADLFARGTKLEREARGEEGAGESTVIEVVWGPVNEDAMKDS
jgi:hypothetical protein